MTKLIIIGAGKGCLQVIETIDALNIEGDKYKIIGILDDNENCHENKVQGIPVLGGITLYSDFKDSLLIWGLGNSNSPDLRLRILKKYQIPINRFFKLIHPTAIISKSSKIGAGVTAYANVYVGGGVRVNSSVGIGIGSIIEHGSKINQGVLIGSSVLIAGNVTIEHGTYIGQGANIKEGIHIGSNSIIGMGAVVLNNVPSFSIVVGNPGKVIKTIKIK